MKPYVLIEDMDPLPGEPFHELQKRHKEFNIGRVPPKVTFRFPKGADAGYRPDLAACPNDPDAYIEGPRSLQKLIDKRKRQGWTVGKRGSAAEVAGSAYKEDDDTHTSYEQCLAEVMAENPDL